LAGTLLILTCLSFGEPSHSHVAGPLGAQPLDWRSAQISGVVAGGALSYFPSHVVTLESRKCVTGNRLHFNVRDEYAFDIDESVELDVEFYLQARTTKVTVSYDRNGTTYGVQGMGDPS